MLVKGVGATGDTMDGEKNLDNAWWLLRITYGLVPIVAGLDKFLNLLVDWSTYLPTWMETLVGDPVVFMYVVGVIEIVAGIGVLTKWTRVFAYVVAAWLLSIAVVLVTGGNYDVAVRDVVMAIGAIALAQLSTLPSVQEHLGEGSSPG